MDLKGLVAELKAEGRIIEAKRKRKRLQIHPGILEPPQGAPPATGGAVQVASGVGSSRTSQKATDFD
jgi:hypothetical protein